MKISSLSRLPSPLDQDTYSLLQKGIADDESVNVYINESRDFAFLDPLPVIDYAKYVPRVDLLGLSKYKQSSRVLEQRVEKIAPLLSGVKSIIEVGAAGAAFLSMTREHFPSLEFHAIEPDQNTRSARDALPWLSQSSSLEEAIGSRVKADMVSMFHVFEHIERPSLFLESVKKLLNLKGILLIEVPCLNDPLLSVYSSDAYQSFYFQRQHPFVYSAASLERVLRVNGFEIERFIPVQRYGLENHLQWLAAEKPGGNVQYLKLFSELEDRYRTSLEYAGLTDTIMITARVIYD